MYTTVGSVEKQAFCKERKFEEVTSVPNRRITYFLRSGMICDILRKQAERNCEA